MFAHMSTTIAETLTEKEFGTQKNALYRPNAEYTSRVIHPVECKRDIFVESVTPVKKGRRRSSMLSIYQLNVGRDRSPYLESNDVHQDSKPKRTQDRGVELGSNANLAGDPTNDITNNMKRSLALTVEVQQKENMELALTYSSDEDDKENEKQQRVVNQYSPSPSRIARRLSSTSIAETHNQLTINSQTANANASANANANANANADANANANANSNNWDAETNLVSNVLSYSISGSTLFRPNNTLRVETGRIETVENVKPTMLHQIPAELHHRDRDTASKDYPRMSRSTAMEVSPSSTVSSLTLPAELDFHTPKEISHQMTLPMIAEDDHVIRTHDYQSAGEGEFSEI